MCTHYVIQIAFIIVHDSIHSMHAISPVHVSSLIQVCSYSAENSSLKSVHYAERGELAYSHLQHYQSIIPSVAIVHNELTAKFIVISCQKKDATTKKNFGPPELAGP